MLKLENITVSYKKKTVIKDLSFEFEDGHHYAVTGASGIGKTTLINVIAGLKKAKSGSVTSSYKRPAYIFQEPRLFPWLTALENVCAVTKDTEKARQLLHRLINEDDIDEKYPNELSGGMKQRVSIARALVYDSDIVLMDEPFKGLDSKTADDVRRFVFDRLSGKTVIMITHSAEDILVCDKVLRMNDSPVSTLESEESGNAQTE